MTTCVATGVRSEINVTPLIDLLLVLLIIFMVITPLTPHGLPAGVPQSATQSQPNEAAVVLEVLRDGALRLNTRDLLPSDLAATVSQVFSSRAGKVLFTEADASLEYREVAQIVDQVQGANLSIQVALMPE